MAVVLGWTTGALRVFEWVDSHAEFTKTQRAEMRKKCLQAAIADGSDMVNFKHVQTAVGVLAKQYQCKLW